LGKKMLKKKTRGGGVGAPKKLWGPLPSFPPRGFKNPKKKGGYFGVKGKESPRVNQTGKGVRPKLG